MGSIKRNNSRNDRKEPPYMEYSLHLRHHAKCFPGMMVFKDYKSGKWSSKIQENCSGHTLGKWQRLDIKSDQCDSITEIQQLDGGKTKKYISNSLILLWLAEGKRDVI